MKLVIRIGDHSGGEGVTYHTATQFPVTLGRGYLNDIILADPHVSARHAEIVHDGEGWLLADIGSDNPIQHGGAALKDRRLRLKSGDEFTIGRTPVAVFDPHHPVAAAARVEHSHAFAAHLAGSMAAWFYPLLALAAACIADYIDYWSENAPAQLAKTAGATALLLVLWALPWALAGRLARHRAGFAAQIALASFFLIVALPLWALLDAVAFVTNEGPLSEALFYGAHFVLLSALVYGSLGIATHMPARKRALSAAVAIGLAMGLLVGLYYLDSQSFYTQPPYSAVLEPYLHDLPAALTIDDFIAGSDVLFSSGPSAENSKK